MTTSINQEAEDLVLNVEFEPRLTPKHDMRAVGFGDNGEGDEGSLPTQAHMLLAASYQVPVQ